MKWIYFPIVFIFFCACRQKESADLIIYNATIYTVDSSFSTAEAMAIKDGKILSTGKTTAILDQYDAKEKTDAAGKFIYPGFIDAHCHFYRYGLGLQTVDLTGTASWAEVVEKIKAFSQTNAAGWLVGRGWDQNDWADKSFPSNEALDSLFTDRPVILTRVDGHAAIANGSALQLAGVKPGQRITGGEIETRAGKLTGILIDNAVDKVTDIIPEMNSRQITDALLRGEQNCLGVGLTTVDDCGVNYAEALLMDSLQKNGVLRIRVFAMLSDRPANYDYLFSKGPLKTERMNVSSFKMYADGALGSRGACLLAPYTDKAGHYGFLLSNLAHFDSVARMVYDKGFQLCTHAIGDSGNRAILNIYAKYLQPGNDRRWRIEHAQVVNENDFTRFNRFNIIPSVQPTHATSDMYWATERLGSNRVKGAYAYKQLLQQNGWIPLGTDFPVEDISPLKTFFSAVVRKDIKGWPAGGYQMENALTREEALKGMTTWAARSNFEEKEKGSLEPGKYADFVILNQDLMHVEASNILKTQIISTYINGELVYSVK